MCILALFAFQKSEGGMSGMTLFLRFMKALSLITNLDGEAMASLPTAPDAFFKLLFEYRKKAMTESKHRTERRNKNK